ncbi:hypothetical protein BC6307_21120 [Sutcliffiella cohnii]|uniref:Uncharacterized protein n=1 Tax=Sutcliffiella cohnii TaxID=33932 RepID=A0A223KVZ0_9BACI|nr:hypothetical protein BC6307_21120 [Sutcliffiella cohnii]
MHLQKLFNNVQLWIMLGGEYFEGKKSCTLKGTGGQENRLHKNWKLIIARKSVYPRYFPHRKLNQKQKTPIEQALNLLVSFLHNNEVYDANCNRQLV